QVRSLRPGVPLCFYGLYAPMNEAYLRSLGADVILGGEFEAALTGLATRLAAAPAGAPLRQDEPLVGVARLAFVAPDRSGLPGLTRYAHLHAPDGTLRAVGATE